MTRAASIENGFGLHQRRMALLFIHSGQRQNSAGDRPSKGHPRFRFLQN